MKISLCEDGLGSRLITGFVETNSIWWPTELLLGLTRPQCKEGENPMHFVLFRPQRFEFSADQYFSEEKEIG